MPSPPSGFAVFMNQLLNATIGVNTGPLSDDLILTSDRVQFSWNELSQDTDFIQEQATLNHGQPYMSIGFPQWTEIDPEYRVSVYEIVCKLYFTISSNKSESFLQITSLISAIKDAWKDDRNFYAPWGSVDNVSQGPMEALDLEQPLFNWCEFRITLRGC